jgi:hypothetical protein
MLLLDRIEIARLLNIINDFEALRYGRLHIIDEQSFLKRQVKFNQIP